MLENSEWANGIAQRQKGERDMWGLKTQLSRSISLGGAFHPSDGADVWRISLLSASILAFLLRGHIVGCSQQCRLDNAFTHVLP